MCGRYTITIVDVADYFKAEQGSFEFAPSYNVAPSQQVPIVIGRESERVITPAKWGLLPGLVKEPKDFKASVFNARSESALEETSFKGRLCYKRLKLLSQSGTHAHFYLL